jgi:hypothetical protein
MSDCSACSPRTRLCTTVPLLIWLPREVRACESAHRQQPHLVVEGDAEGPHAEAHAVDEGLPVVALPVPLVHEVIGQLACITGATAVRQ